MGATNVVLGSAVAGAVLGAPYGPAGMVIVGLYGGAVGVFLSPVGALVGSAAGAVKAVPAETVKTAEAALKNALADVKLHEALRDEVVQVARDRTSHPFVLLPEQGPTSVGEQASYRSLADEGIDSVLEISVGSIGFVTERRKEPDSKNIGFVSVEWAVNPPLALVITARARLIRVRDDAELFVPTFEHRSTPRAFTTWGDNNAQEFREELERASKSLGERIVNELSGPAASPESDAKEKIDEPLEAVRSFPVRGGGV